MNSKDKAFLIDFTLLFIYGIFIFCLLYFGYGYIYTRRVIAFLIILISIPLCWGTAIMSIMGKNTLGHRIVNKNNK